MVAKFWILVAANLTVFYAIYLRITTGDAGILSLSSPVVVVFTVVLLLDMIEENKKDKKGFTFHKK